jgi:hypothetical protein
MNTRASQRGVLDVIGIAIAAAAVAVVVAAATVAVYKAVKDETAPQLCCANLNTTALQLGVQADPPQVTAGLETTLGLGDNLGEGLIHRGSVTNEFIVQDSSAPPPAGYTRVDAIVNPALASAAELTITQTWSVTTCITSDDGRSFDVFGFFAYGFIGAGPLSSHPFNHPVSPSWHLDQTSPGCTVVGSGTFIDDVPLGLGQTFALQLTPILNPDQGIILLQQVQVEVVPEPPAVLLVVLGLGLLAFRRLAYHVT